MYGLLAGAKWVLPTRHVPLAKKNFIRCQMFSIRDVFFVELVRSLASLFSAIGIFINSLAIFVVLIHRSPDLRVYRHFILHVLVNNLGFYVFQISTLLLDLTIHVIAQMEIFLPHIIIAFAPYLKNESLPIERFALLVGLLRFVYQNMAGLSAWSRVYNNVNCRKLPIPSVRLGNSSPMGRALLQ